MNFKSGEIFITEQKEKAYKEDLQEKKNLSGYKSSSDHRITSEYQLI